MSDPVEMADKFFNANHNCSQSILGAFAQQYGLKAETADRLASAFGGGMARHGDTCGAVCGALMVIGLAYGASTPEAKEKVYALAQEFMRRFKEKHGSHYCRDLIGADISTPEGLEKARQNPDTHNVCPSLVHDAALILKSLLASN